MAKRINMTRERQRALPIVLEAARKLVEEAGLSAAEYKLYRDALEAFRDH